MQSYASDDSCCICSDLDGQSRAPVPCQSSYRLTCGFCVSKGMILSTSAGTFWTRLYAFLTLNSSYRSLTYFDSQRNFLLLKPSDCSSALQLQKQTRQRKQRCDCERCLAAETLSPAVEDLHKFQFSVKGLTIESASP